MVKCVNVEFPGTPNKTYIYFIPEGLEDTVGGEIEVGDWVIVDSPFTAYTAVLVREVVENGTAMKPVIGYANLSHYLDNKAKVLRRQELERQLEARSKQLDKLQKYELLTKYDESAKPLYDELLSLT